MKNVFKQTFTAVACAAAILAGSGAGHAADYTFSDLYLSARATSPNYFWNPGAGKPENKAYGINDNGQVTGYLKGQYSGSQTHLIRWDNVGQSSMTSIDLGIPLNTPVKTGVGNGINNSGQIVGYCWGFSNFYNGMLYTPTSSTTGTALNLNDYMNTTNNFKQTNALAINDSGKVVGIAGQTGTGNFTPPTAFFFNGSTMINIPGATLGSPTGSSSATSISNTGLVTGYSSDSANQKKAYIWDSNNITASITLMSDSLNAVSSWGNDINDSGSAVGGYTLSDGVKHAFLYQGGAMQDIGSLGAGAEAMAINNSGVIVGTSNGHAFMYKNGAMTDLNTLIDSALGFTLISATGINNLGQIVGYGTVQTMYTDGKYYTQERAFALSPDPMPTPIPAALPLFVSGLGALGLLRRRFSLG